MAYHYELCMWLNNCTKFWHIIQHAQHITNPNLAKTVQKSKKKETFVMFETWRLIQYLNSILFVCNIPTLYIVSCSFAFILLCYQGRQILIVLYLYPVEWTSEKFSVKSIVLLLSRWDWWVLQYCYFLSFAYIVFKFASFSSWLTEWWVCYLSRNAHHCTKVSSFLSFLNLCC